MPWEGQRGFAGRAGFYIEHLTSELIKSAPAPPHICPQSLERCSPNFPFHAASGGRALIQANKLPFSSKTHNPAASPDADLNINPACPFRLLQKHVTGTFPHLQGWRGPGAPVTSERSPAPFYLPVNSESRAGLHSQTFSPPRTSAVLQALPASHLPPSLTGGTAPASTRQGPPNCSRGMA